MGIGDSMKDLAGKAKDKVTPDQAKEGLDQAEDRGNQATGGKFKDQMDKGRQMGEDRVDRLYDDQS